MSGVFAFDEDHNFPPIDCGILDLFSAFWLRRTSIRIIPTIRTKMAMPPRTPPTIAPTLFLDEFGFGVLDVDVLLKAGDVVGEEANEAVTGDSNEDVVAPDDVVDVENADVDVEDFDAKDDVPDGLLLVVSPFERKIPFFSSQQGCATVPLPQQ